MTMSARSAGAMSIDVEGHGRRQEPLIRADLHHLGAAREREEVEAAVRRVDHAKAVTPGLDLEERKELSVDQVDVPLDVLDPRRVRDVGHGVA